MKRIALLGSTGSIGRQTLEVIESLGPNYKVVALSAGSNYRLLAEQVLRFKPEIAVLNETAAINWLRASLKDVNCKLVSGRDGQLSAAAWPSADLVVLAQVGFSGFEPLVAALKNNKTVALANKESLVVGGELLSHAGLLDRDKIIPIDSEHSAIRQSWTARNKQEIAHIYLTASGGPFHDFNNRQLDAVTPEMALNHPTWKMGKKITIDSATLMNKGLEVIEAKWLFDLKLDQIKVVIHRQSIVHSMVEYIDGSILAQLSLPDMRLPIQYALTYPERLTSLAGSFNPYEKTLSFAEPDQQKFPCLKLAYRAADQGGTMPAVLNGANEAAVDLFLKKELAFTSIPFLIEQVMDKHVIIDVPELADLIEADRWARFEALKICEQFRGKVK